MILNNINDGLAKLGHSIRLSEVHQTGKGNLVVTAAPDVSAEQLDTVKTALSSILAPFSNQPVSVYRDVKWSKLLLHNVWTGKSDKEPPHSSEDIHRELIAHNPAYRELTITQKPSWVKNPAELKNRSSICFAFEDPDGKICNQFMHSHKVLYLFGDRSPIRCWLKAKELRCVETGCGKMKQNPATGANKTEMISGKLKQSTTALDSQPSFPSLPPKPPNIPTQSAATSNRLSGAAVEVASAPIEKALDQTNRKGQKVKTSINAQMQPQPKDVDMIIDKENADDDEDYITEEEYVEGYSGLSRRGGNFYNTY